jgi:hypothetical protein
MSALLSDLATRAWQANDAYLDGTIGRNEHAVAIAQIDRAAQAAGLTWDDIDAAVATLNQTGG